MARQVDKRRGWLTWEVMMKNIGKNTEISIHGERIHNQL